MKYLVAMEIEVEATETELRRRIQELLRTNYLWVNYINVRRIEK